MNTSDFKTIVLEPGEVLVLTTDKTLSDEEIKHIKEEIKKNFPKNNTIVLDSGVDIVAKLVDCGQNLPE